MTPTDDMKKRLQDHRQDIINAELAGYLHVVNRMNRRFVNREKTLYNTWRVVCPTVLKAEVSDALKKNLDDWEKSATSSGADRDAARRLWRFKNEYQGALTAADEGKLAQIVIKTPGEEWPLGDLVTLSFGDFIKAASAPIGHFVDREFRSLLLFNASHAQASGLKGGGGTGNPKETLASVFGRERPVAWVQPGPLQEAIELAAKAGANGGKGSRLAFLEKWKELSQGCLSHDRRPLNDVSAWAYGDAVAAYFKAAVALVWARGQWPEVDKIEWTLLAAGYPGLELIGSAVRITDVLARRDWVQGKLDHLQELLEYEVPVGNEIYRDENGAVYLLAKTAADDGPVGLAKALAEECTEKDDDFRPYIAEHPQAAGKLLPIWEAIESMKAGRPLPENAVAAAWQGVKGREVCAVCGLRPAAGEGAGENVRRGEERFLCESCWKRRRELKSSQNWMKIPGAEGEDRRGQRITARSETIWIDEAADEHGICALLAGRIELKGWLESNPGVNYFQHQLITGSQAKGPDFMRVQSCWETTREFWRAVSDAMCKRDCRRIRVCLENAPASLRKGWAYETAVAATTVTLVWTGDYLLTASNLKYCAKQAGLRLEELRTKLEAGSLELESPRGYSRDAAGDYELQDRPEETITVRPTKAEWDEILYRPVIPVLAEPRHFLAILPASATVSAAASIEEAYRTELGKAASMLPLALGIVFFDRRTPIYAVMQAAQKLLRMPLREERVCVKEKNGNEIVLEPQDGKRPFRIPAKVCFNDGCEDTYYTAFRGKGGQTIVRAQLNPGSEVLYQPSQFDFTHLETTGHRYRLGYWADGRRLDPDRPTRPLLLGDIGRLSEIWKMLKTGLKPTQISQLFSDLERKREAWGLEYPVRDEVFRRLAESAVDSAEWEDGAPDGEKRENLLEAITSGLFRDVIELYMKILKEGGD